MAGEQIVTDITWIAFIGVFLYVFYLFIKKEFGGKVNIKGEGGLLDKLKGG